MTDRYKKTFNTWNKVANLYEEKFMHLDIYNHTYDTFCQLIKKENPTVLEIGCGPGNITKYIQTKRPDLNILGIDIAANMIELAKKNIPTANFEIMDSRNINRIETKFEAIISGFCLPYLSNTDRSKLIKDCKNLLSEKGLLYISFVDGNYDKSHYQTGSTGDSLFFYYHELKNIKTELIKNNFKILNIINVTYNKTNETEIHTVLIAEKDC